MRRLVLFALLTISILIAAPSQAQRGGGGARIAGGGSHFGGRGFANGPFPGRRGYGRFGNYGWAFPWYYGDWDWGWDLGPSDSDGEPAAQPASPSVIVLQSRDEQRPAAPVESPKLIEIPLTQPAGAAAKPEPPTLFVLASGERLEARRYTLTADSLRIQIDRHERTIALSKLDLDATIAANRERGIDLQIPTDKTQIFLSF